MLREGLKSDRLLGGSASAGIEIRHRIEEPVEAPATPLSTNPEHDDTIQVSGLFED
jgi:hypothetical protein